MITAYNIAHILSLALDAPAFHATLVGNGNEVRDAVFEKIALLALDVHSLGRPAQSSVEDLVRRRHAGGRRRLGVAHDFPRVLIASAVNAVAASRHSCGHLGPASRVQGLSWLHGPEVGASQEGSRRVTVSASGTGETRTSSRLIVRTKASAMPLLWGLSKGVVRGSSPISRAKRRVSAQTATTDEGR